MHEETLERTGNGASAVPETWHSARARVALTVMGILAPNALDSPTQREMSVARQNGIGFEYADHFRNAAAILADEQERLTCFLNALETTAASFQAAEIPHILIKHRRHYRYYDSNVDVVVSHGDWDRAVALLRSQGYAGNVMFKEPDKIMFDHPAMRVSVHLHPGVTWNGVPYISTDCLWINAHPQGNEFRRELSDDLEFLVNMGHVLFENYEITLGDLLFFSRALNGHSFDSARLSRIAGANGWDWGYEQVFAQVESLAEDWNTARDTEAVPNHLLDYPFPISPAVLARSYSRRIFSNARHGNLRHALREVYAYPTFYALKRRHDLRWLGRR